MAEVSLLERLDEHKIRVCPQAVRLGHKVVQLFARAAGTVLRAEDVVDIADNLVEIRPGEVAALNLACIALTGLVVVILPEPSGSFCCLDHILSHQLCCQVDSHNPEALMGIGRHEIYSVIKSCINSVQSHLYRFCIFQNQLFVHICSRRGIQELRTGGNQCRAKEQHQHCQAESVYFT